MPTPLPPFTRHHVRLVGHRNLGTVTARYVGCWLEIDHPEHGGRYGPSAVFRAEPVVEASRGALVWSKHSHGYWCLTGHDIDGDSVFYFNGPPSLLAREATNDGYEVPPWPGEPAAPVEPQPEPVPAPVGTWQVTYEVPQKLAIGDVGWEGKPAPKDRTVYDPDDVQRGDVHHLADGTRGTVLGCLHGWMVYTDRVPTQGLAVVRVEPANEHEDDDIPF